MEAYLIHVLRHVDTFNLNEKSSDVDIKHLKMLCSNKYIKKNGEYYVLTRKGRKALAGA